MFINRSHIISVGEICRSYPNEWIAIAVAETDADGFAVSGEVLVHDTEERFVWPAINLGEIEDPVYIFFTGEGRENLFAA